MNNNEFRVICTKGEGNRWIKGEIYECKNGIIKDSRETKWGSFDNFNQFREWIISSFIDVYFKEFKFNIGDKAIERKTNKEVVIYGYFIDKLNDLEYIISSNKSKNTLRYKIGVYPEAIVGEEYMDETCIFSLSSNLIKKFKEIH